MNRPMLPAPGALVFGAVMFALSIVAMFHTRRCERCRRGARQSLGVLMDYLP